MFKRQPIVGCIYKHLDLNINEYIDYLKDLCYKISFENKDILLLGDFNINLLNYDKHLLTTEFLDLMYSNTLIPKINLPTRITTHSSTLIDNIFSSTLTNDFAENFPYF